MKTKIGSTKKLIMATMALVASLGVAAGSTFAWFTTSDNVTIDSLGAQVVSGSDSLTMAVVGPDIAIDAAWVNGNRFSQSISATDITAVIGATSTLAAATTTTGTTFVSRENTPVSANQADGGYYSFKLVFRNRVDGGNENIYLADGSTIAPVTTETTDNEDGTTTETTLSGTAVPFNTAQYTRIATNVGLIAPEGQTPTANATYYGSDTAYQITAATTTLTSRAAYAARATFVPSLATETTTKIWAPNEYNADGGNDDATAALDTAKGYYLHNLADDYYHDYLTDSSQTTLAQASLANSVVALPAANEDGSLTLDDDNLVTSFAGGLTNGVYIYTAITVNIWIEGTDGDCFDTILEDKFETTLKFIVAEAPTQTNP